MGAVLPRRAGLTLRTGLHEDLFGTADAYLGCEVAVTIVQAVLVLLSLRLSGLDG